MIEKKMTKPVERSWSEFKLFCLVEVPITAANKDMAVNTLRYRMNRAGATDIITLGEII